MLSRRHVHIHTQNWESLRNDQPLLSIIPLYIGNLLHCLCQMFDTQPVAMGNYIFAPTLRSRRISAGGAGVRVFNKEALTFADTLPLLPLRQQPFVASWKRRSTLETPSQRVYRGEPAAHPAGAPKCGT
jgi:hypothetical protein